MTCSFCNGTGWKLIDQGGREVVARCSCWQESLVQRLLADAQIPRRYHHCSFERFETYGNEKLENAVKEARLLAKTFPVVSKGLFIHGRPGVGKTHIAVAALRQVIEEKRAHGLFYDLSELLKLIRHTYNPSVGTSETDILRPVMEAELLVLDDLGREKTSLWVEETLNLIVNTRYNERRVTIFTSNYDVGELDDPDSLQVRVGFRMYSRLHEMCEFLHIDGADYRELPRNGGVDDLRTLWKLRKYPPTSRKGPGPVGSSPAGGGLPSRSSSQARVRRSTEPFDLKWRGGKAGT
jgi:DNA replication protein DnaC